MGMLQKQINNFINVIMLKQAGGAKYEGQVIGKPKHGDKQLQAVAILLAAARHNQPYIRLGDSSSF